MIDIEPAYSLGAFFLHRRALTEANTSRLDLILEVSDERLDDLRIEVPSRTHGELREGIARRHRLAVTAFLGDRIVRIGDRNYAAAQRDLFTAEPARITRSVPAFVMRSRNQRHVRKLVRKTHLGQQS